MKAIRNFCLKWLFITLALSGLAVWFVQSQWLSNYELINNTKLWAKSYVLNLYQTKKSESIQWALNKVNYHPNQESSNSMTVPTEVVKKEVLKLPASSVMAPAEYKGVSHTEVMEESKQTLSIIKIPYYYDTSREPENISREDMLSILNKASLAWEQACGIAFEFKGERMSDYVNVKNTLPTQEGLVRWNNLDGDAIGQAHQGSARGPAQGFVLSLSPSYFAKQANHSFLYSTVLHEMGHVIGMGHNKNPDSIMFWQQLNRKQTLSQTDKAMCKYFRARWSGMSAQAAQDKYKVLVNDDQGEDEEEVDE